MKSNRKALVGILVLIFIAIVSAYFLYYRDRGRASDDPSKNKKPKIDSATGSNHEVIPEGMGTKPEADPKDGSVKIVEEFIKSNAKNPATFEFLEWSEISSEDGYWKVRCKYTGISSFNAEVTTNAWFYMQNNKVVYTKIISKI